MTRHDLLFAYAAALFLTYAAMRAGDWLYAHSSSFLSYAPAHFLGGVAVGVFVLLMGNLLGIRPKLMHCILTVMVIGTAWEAWEYSLGVVEYPADAIDTLSDYVMNTAGALVSFFLLRKQNIS